MPLGRLWAILAMLFRPRPAVVQCDRWGHIIRPDFQAPQPAPARRTIRSSLKKTGREASYLAMILAAAAGGSYVLSEPNSPQAVVGVVGADDSGIDLSAVGGAENDIFDNTESQSTVERPLSRHDTAATDDAPLRSPARVERKSAASASPIYLDCWEPNGGKLTCIVTMHSVETGRLEDYLVVLGEPIVPYELNYGSARITVAQNETAARWNSERRRRQLQS